MDEVPYTKKEKAFAAALIKDSKEQFEAYFQRRRETVAFSPVEQSSLRRANILKEYVNCGGILLDKTSALEKARKALLTKMAGKATAVAKEVYRKKNPPQYCCPKCSSVFFNSHSLEVHICEKVQSE